MRSQPYFWGQNGDGRRRAGTDAPYHLPVGTARLSQRASRNRRSAGFSPLRLTMKGALKSTQSCDRAVKRAEARAPQLSEICARLENSRIYVFSAPPTVLLLYNSYASDIAT